jgi:hypothetical protein
MNECRGNRGRRGGGGGGGGVGRGGFEMDVAAPAGMLRDRPGRGVRDDGCYALRAGGQKRSTDGKEHGLGRESLH